MNLNQLGTEVLDCAFKVHTNLGPGLLESTYEASLVYEIRKKGISAEHQKALPLVYEEIRLEVGYRIDILVESHLVIEVKAIESINDVHLAQILTYMKLSRCELGYLLNFNVARLKEGIKRVIMS